MKYNIHIDQVHSIEWGLNLSEAAAFAFCYNLPSWAETIQTDGEIYYFAARTKVIEEMPILSDKPDTIYRLYKAIELKGLIKYRKFSGKDLIQITAKGKRWNSENFPNTSINSEKNPKILGKKSEFASENFPTYNSTIIDKKTIDTNIKPESKIQPPPTPALPPAELKVMEALLKAERYFQQWPDQQQMMCERAKRSDALHPKVFRDTLEAWIRYNIDNPAIICHIETSITKSFQAWLTRNLEANNRSKNGFARPAGQDAAPTAYKAPVNQKLQF